MASLCEAKAESAGRTSKLAKMICGVRSKGLGFFCLNHDTCSKCSININYTRYILTWMTPTEGPSPFGKFHMWRCQVIARKRTCFGSSLVLGYRKRMHVETCIPWLTATMCSIQFLLTVGSYELHSGNHSFELNKFTGLSFGCMNGYVVFWENLPIWFWQGTSSQTLAVGKGYSQNSGTPTG